MSATSRIHFHLQTRGDLDSDTQHRSAHVGPFDSNSCLADRKGVSGLMSIRRRITLARAGVGFALLLILVPSPMAKPGGSATNSWRGITPLRSSAADVARLVGSEPESTDAMLSGPSRSKAEK